MGSLLAPSSWWHSRDAQLLGAQCTASDSRPVTIATSMPASCSSRMPRPSVISKRFISTRAPAAVAPR